MPKVDDLKGLLEWRCIGPFRGGRVVAVAGDPSDPATFYFGACATLLITASHTVLICTNK